MSNCTPNTNRFFSPSQTHIKMYEGSFVAVEGPNMTHKMSSLPSIRFPYQQVMTARITLRAGQTNYLLNHLGLGDNATFLAITAQYDTKSKFESDNFVQYSYYSNKNRLFSFSNMLVLTGNSENRVEQLYLHNPNQNSPVILEVMVAVIDEYYNFFEENDVSCENSYTYTNLKHTDVSLWDNDDSVLVVTNSFGQPISYLNLDDINSITQDSKILTIDENSIGNVILVFQTEYDATQARVKISQWIDDYNNGTVTPPADDFEPIISFTSLVTDETTVLAYGEGLTSLDGNRSYIYGSAVALSSYSGTVTKATIRNLIISVVRDFENTVINVNDTTDIIIKNENGVVLTDINTLGEYYIFFDISDVIGNKVDSEVNVKLNIVS